ncbi:hypothetical protein GCM10011506_23500 [Marivirga lumbricoides]|uniref:Polysaccharide biosynthesis protein C-terminal domain-containing protein n=2 Tax=Marivirga lumbricoides TaxID=1046115 RepID=A0ABQ1MEP7_9BACT|nr:hypothetical protein GCM10011506_23500 [Marivirga lumbricoides]
MTRSNSVLIGTFLGYNWVAIYDILEKIVGALLIPFNLLNQSSYPAIAEKKDLKLFNKVFKISLISSLAIYLLLLMTGEVIFSILSGATLERSNYYYLIYYGLLIPIVNIIYQLTTLLIVKNKNKYYSKSLIYSLLVYILGVIIIYYFNVISLFTIISVKLFADVSNILIMLQYNKK